MPRAFPALCAVLLLSGLAGTRLASGQGAPAPQAPTFRTGVNFVRVDVIVTDRAGQPIFDLEQGDFEVTESGRPQAIETFKLVRLDGGATAAAPARPVRTDADVELEASRDDVRLFGVFLDDYHVRRLNARPAGEAVARFIEAELGPSDIVGVMAPLQLASSVRWTRDRAAVAEAVRRFEGRKYEYTQARNDMERQYANQCAAVAQRIRSQISLSAIRGLVTQLGSLKEGRKSVLVVSEGFAYTLPFEILARDVNCLSVTSQGAATMPFANAEMQKDLREVYDAANRNNVAIYTVDPRRLAASEFDIEQSVPTGTDRDFLRGTLDTLQVLAEQTDGRALVSRNNLDQGLREVVRDASGYYLLGYSSTQSGSDGRFHEIKVAVKRAGLQVRARKGYWALTVEDVARASAPPAAAPSKAVETALAAIGRPAGSRVIRTWLGMSRGENGKTKVTFVWEPMPAVPGGRTASGSDTPSRVTLLALGPDGAPYFRGAVPEVSTGGLTSRAARVSFDASPGRLQLRVSVEGTSSRLLDAETRDVAIPDLGAPETLLGTPLLLRGRTLPEYQQIKADAGAVPVATREFSRSDRLMVRVPVYGPGGTLPALRARLLSRAGRAMADLAAAEGGPPGLPQFDVPIAGLAPDDYLVEIEAVSEGLRATEIIGFRVMR
jgi:VWFA-related protein